MSHYTPQIPRRDSSPADTVFEGEGVVASQADTSTTAHTGDRVVGDTAGKQRHASEPSPIEDLSQLFLSAAHATPASRPKTPTRTKDTASQQSGVTPGLDGTPRHVKVSTQGLNLEPKYSNAHREAVNKEMRTAWALINDIDEWDRICHQSEDDVPPSVLKNAGDFSDVPFDKPEFRYYAPLCTAINKLLDSCDRKYMMRVTGCNPEPGSHVEMRPDICMYENTGAARDAFTLPSVESQKKKTRRTKSTKKSKKIKAQNTQAGEQATRSAPVTSGGNGVQEVKLRETLEAIKPYQARTAWAWATMLVEVKADDSAAPYSVGNDGKISLSTAEHSSNTRAQIIKYASEALLRQHRQFFFTAVLVRRQAYLMRWDRTGAIVTAPFDFVAEPEKLLRFFYRIAVASRALQGYDPTVTLASKEEVEIFKTYRDSLPDAFLRTYVKEALDNETYHPIHKVTCPCPQKSPRRDSPRSEEVDVPAAAAVESGSAHASVHHDSEPTGPYLVGKHRHGTRSPTGRGGKGFVAYDMSRKCSVFLKDYWCAVHRAVHPETEVYQKLAEADVRCVATLLAGGDVADHSGVQETLTQEYLAGAKRAAKRRHHRLVVKEVGRPLESYLDTQELILALYHALLAHCDAYEKAKILHRDVSMANILIDVETGAAFLNDWDLCKYIDELSMEASQHSRSGTWPYMSATLVQYPRKPNELADDIESFLHVFTITILRFQSHSLSRFKQVTNLPLTEHLNTRYYSAQETSDGYHVGFGHKMTMMKAGDPGFTLPGEDSILSVLLHRLYKLGAEHYSTLNFQHLEEQWGSIDVKRDITPTETSEQVWNPFALVLPPPFSCAIDAQGSSNILTTPATSLSNVITSDNDPTSASSKPLVRDFHSHTHIITTIWEIIQGRNKWKVLQDKKRDQFEQLERSQKYHAQGTSSRGSKRSSQPEESGSSSASVPKKLRLSHSTPSSRLESVDESHERELYLSSS